jgi:hypothetical protein
LIRDFESELFDLIPCWLTTAESCGTIFELKKTFDLVVMDEASQCKVEEAIPALYRGAQSLILGDEKQLAPNDLYAIKATEEDLGDITLEMQSALDLASFYFPKQMLEGHYRSRTTDLIEFSNQYFYEGKLNFLPNYHHYKDQTPGIQYIKVDGVWKNNRNETEANKVIELLAREIPLKKSVGVITFNYEQQHLIQDLVENSELVLPPNLEVKNIENMQGDEFDVVIFSIGYGPRENGKISGNFGLLNLEHGENRLNVAITRAKEKIYVVTSVLPHQLNVDEAKNLGPKLLKAYLQYSLEVSERKEKVFFLQPGRHGYDWYLKNKVYDIVKSEGLESRQTPFSDLVVEVHGESKLILTDDDRYQTAQSTKAVHAYRLMRMRENDWPHNRYYSRLYWRDKERFEDLLKRYLLT